MAYYSDKDILIISEPGNVWLNLQCGYGQPAKTTLYLKKLDGSTIKLDEFEGNIENYELGDSNLLKGQVFEVHSTIHDIRDIIPGREFEDIRLSISVGCRDELVETEFLKRTKGKGQLFVCMYEVIVF